MNQRVHPEDNYEMRPEYDFSHGIRGKHFRAYRAGTNVVLLEPDVAKAFTDSASVNQALRMLLQIARTSIPAGAGGSKTVRTNRGGQGSATKSKSSRSARG